MRASIVPALAVAAMATLVTAAPAQAAPGPDCKLQVAAGRDDYFGDSQPHMFGFAVVGSERNARCDGEYRHVTLTLYASIDGKPFQVAGTSVGETSKDPDPRFNGRDAWTNVIYNCRTDPKLKGKSHKLYATAVEKVTDEKKQTPVVVRSCLKAA